MIILAILSSVSSGASGESIGLLDLAIIAGALAIPIPISMFVLPKVLKKISKSQEYFITIFTWLVPSTSHDFLQTQIIYGNRRTYRRHKLIDFTIST